VTERAILFSGPMVRAILAGTKTQTRRVVSPRPPRVEDVHAKAGIDYGWFTDRRTPGRFQVSGPVWAVRELGGSIADTGLSCPYGVVGDRLWVRETFALVWPGEYAPESVHENRVEYHADTGAKYPGGWPNDCGDDPDCGRWKPSIHMPRWASRITLDVTGVRVERLQEISRADADAEGVASILGHPESFATLWNSINGKREGRTWADNPWVWCVEFRRAT